MQCVCTGLFELVLLLLSKQLDYYRRIQEYINLGIYRASHAVTVGTIA